MAGTQSTWALPTSTTSSRLPRVSSEPMTTRSLPMCSLSLSLFLSLFLILRLHSVVLTPSYPLLPVHGDAGPRSSPSISKRLPLTRSVINNCSNGRTNHSHPSSSSCSSDRAPTHAAEYARQCTSAFVQHSAERRTCGDVTSVRGTTITAVIRKSLRMNE